MDCRRKNGRYGSARTPWSRNSLRRLCDPANDMTMWPVSTCVGNVKDNDPSLIEPIKLSAG